MVSPRQAVKDQLRPPWFISGWWRPRGAGQSMAPGYHSCHAAPSGDAVMIWSKFVMDPELITPRADVSVREGHGAVAPRVNALVARTGVRKTSASSSCAGRGLTMRHKGRYGHAEVSGAGSRSSLLRMLDSRYWPSLSSKYACPSDELGDRAGNLSVSPLPGAL